MDLENKVALVTGAGVRIGQAVAVKLGQLGMRLVIHYHHSEEGAKQTIQRLPGKKSRHLVLKADLKDVSAIKELVHKAEKQAGPVSVLVNNAAEFFPTPLFSVAEEEWDIRGAFITDATFGDMDYATADPVEIAITVQPDECILRY